MDLGLAKSVVSAGRFFGALPRQLLRPIGEGQAATMLAERLAQRNERFLERLRLDVFDRPGSIYHELMRHAGCEYGDLEREVRLGGLEPTLLKLFRAGVWVSVDEFKGRKPIQRGRLKLEAGPERLRSPRAAYHLRGSSGGSRSGGTPVLFDLRFVRDCAANLANLLAARGGANWVKADWESPGGGARFRLIQMAMFGAMPAAWFCQLDPDDPRLAATARWNTRAMWLAGALAGKRFPAPVHAPLSDPRPAFEWAAEVRRGGGTPMIFTFPSSAVRLCVAAMKAGAKIGGTWFVIAGEPITSACVGTIESAGCRAIPRYGSMETAAIGYGCVEPRVSDDLHVLSDMQGLIQAGDGGAEAAGLPERALLVTALHARSPFLMLNTSMGDEGTIEENRRCGCALEALGWTRHIHTIRSFEKLTTLGVTFLGGEVIPVLERVLPERLGGAPTSYQLVESEASDGQPRLALRVHPDVGPVDSDTILREFCAAVDAVSSASADRLRLWRDAGTLRVERKAPVVSRVGKILHIHRLGAGEAEAGGVER